VSSIAQLSWAAALRIGAAGLAFMMNWALVASVAADESGAYYTFAAATTMGALFARSGQDAFMLATISRGKRSGLDLAADHRLSVGVVISQAVVAALVVGIVIASLAPGLALVAAATVVTTSILIYHSECLRGFGLVSVPMLVSTATVPIALLLALAIEHTLTARDLATIHLGATTLGATWTAVLLAARGVVPWRHRGGPNVPWRAFLRRIEDGWSTGAGLVISGLWSSLDVILLAFVAAPATIASYAFASRLATALVLPLAGVNYSAAPNLIRAITESRIADFESLMRRASTVATTAGVAIAVALASALTIMPIGELERPRLIAVFAVLALGQLVNLLTGPVGWAHIALGRERRYLTIVALATICGALTLPAAGIAWGALGAASVSAAVVGLGNGIAWFSVRRILGRVHAA
jgi:O-antigen/teichoic acid export membrane protein